jgi:hypothetical protein
MKVLVSWFAGKAHHSDKIAHDAHNTQDQLKSKTGSRMKSQRWSKWLCNVFITYVYQENECISVSTTFILKVLNFRSDQHFTNGVHILQILKMTCVNLRWINILKGIVQRILRGVARRLKQSELLNWRPASFSFWIFLGTPSGEEHKTVFSSLSKINWLYLVKVMLRCSLQQSTILSVIHTYIDFPQSANSGKSIFF